MKLYGRDRIFEKVNIPFLHRKVRKKKQKGSKLDSMTYYFGKERGTETLPSAPALKPANQTLPFSTCPMKMVPMVPGFVALQRSLEVSRTSTKLQNVHETGCNVQYSSFNLLARTYFRQDHCSVNCIELNGNVML